MEANEPTASLSVARAANHVAATAFGVMCTDVIRLAAAVPSDSLSLLGAPANARLGGGLSLGRHAGKGGDCLVELADRQSYAAALFKSETRFLVKSVVALFLVLWLTREELNLLLRAAMSSTFQDSPLAATCWARTRRRPVQIINSKSLASKSNLVKRIQIKNMKKSPNCAP